MSFYDSINRRMVVDRSGVPKFRYDRIDPWGANLIQGDVCYGPAIIFEFEANWTILRDSPNVKGNKRSICATGSAEIDMPGTRGFMTV